MKGVGTIGRGRHRFTILTRKGDIMDARQNLIHGDLEQALQQLQLEVRKDPSDVKHRIFLFQLLVVMGQWDRALTQLNLIGELDAGALAMVQTYREAIFCEALRKEVFAGKRTPVVFGEPEQWTALLFEALRLAAEGQYDKSQDVRDQAFELAPTTSGLIDEPQMQSFNWIADADPRLGPMLEVIINGRYYWLPFQSIRTIQIEAPEDLRDQVWMPAHFTLANEGETVGLIPTRYVGSEHSDDNQIRCGHKTIWQQIDTTLFEGLGQRMLATDIGEFSLMDLRQIRFGSLDELTTTSQVERKRRNISPQEVSTENG